MRALLQYRRVARRQIDWRTGDPVASVADRPTASALLVKSVVLRQVSSPEKLRGFRVLPSSLFR